jgi:hypothetical protein
VTATPQGAVMLLSVWLDEGALRVRLTAADDLEGPSRPVGVAGSVDDACDVVRRWLLGVEEGAAEAGRADGAPSPGVG